MTFFDAAFLDDPYPTYAYLREHQPIVQLSSLGGRIWLVTRYEDIRATLSSDAFIEYDLPQIIGNKRTSEPRFSALERYLRDWLFFMSAADHRALKKVLSPLYADANISTFKHVLVEFVSDAFENLDGGHSIDMISALADPLPMVAAGLILGLNLTDRDLTKAASCVIKVLEPMQRVSNYAEIEHCFNTLDRWLEKNVAYRRNLSSLDNYFEDADKDETDVDRRVRSIIVMLLASGQDTLSSAIGNCAHSLLNHPDQAELLGRDPSLVPGAVKELLRFDPAAQIIARVASRDQELGGKTILAGQRVCLALGSANRDPAFVSDPDVLNVTRRPTAGMAFGHGAHFCVGSHLAYAVIEAVIRNLVKHPGIRIVPGSEKRRSGYVFRGLEELRIKREYSC